MWIGALQGRTRDNACIITQVKYYTYWITPDSRYILYCNYIFIGSVGQEHNNTHFNTPRSLHMNTDSKESTMSLWFHHQNSIQLGGRKGFNWDVTKSITNKRIYKCNIKIINWISLCYSNILKIVCMGTI